MHLTRVYTWSSPPPPPPQPPPCSSGAGHAAVCEAILKDERAQAVTYDLFGLAPLHKVRDDRGVEEDHSAHTIMLHTALCRRHVSAVTLPTDRARVLPCVRVVYCCHDAQSTRVCSAAMKRSQHVYVALHVCRLAPSMRVRVRVHSYMCVHAHVCAPALTGGWVR